MSDRMLDDIGSAVPGRYGAVEAGAADASVVLSEATIAAAWNVQGDATDPALVASTQGLFGIALPAANATTRSDTLIALWLGPRSWLLVERSSSAALSILTDFAPKRDALNACSAALFELSASRIAYRVGGSQAAVVLAKSCPLDFDLAAFPLGACQQSVFGHINALFYREDALTFVIMIGRSLAGDAWRSLCRSSAQYGYDVVPSRCLPASD